MWNDLPADQREEYKRMILAFASLTEIFAQKAENDEQAQYSPIINSKYQETVFQRVFGASAEDIGNTSYDAAIERTNPDGTKTKYLIGIKTFGLDAGAQKVAQFKANHDEWSDIINRIRENAQGKTKDDINSVNKDLYYQFACRIAELRNMRISSSEANLQGISAFESDDDIHKVYHVLMPSPKHEAPTISVGETSYDKINLRKLIVKGCTAAKNPTNFTFTDGNHTYKYTSADSQLYMEFNNREIVQDIWNVIYVDDAYSVFAALADKVCGMPKSNIVESYSWKLCDKNNHIERYSGYNGFYGLGSKLGKKQRPVSVAKLRNKYCLDIDGNVLDKLTSMILKYLEWSALKQAEKSSKENLRNEILKIVHGIGNTSLTHDVRKLVYRTQEEMYIPIPNAHALHDKNPDFFKSEAGLFLDDNKTLKHKKYVFNLIFEPSGEIIPSFLTQDYGKGIRSFGKQSYLGNWILKGVFQLKDYEPLTYKKLKEVGINGLRLYKLSGSDDIHLEFIWIDDDNLPEDYWE